MSNIILSGINLHFIGNDGYFYKLNNFSFNDLKKIEKVDNNPDANKYLTKKLVNINEKIFFCNDNGKLFSYDTKNKKNDLIILNNQNIPLIGTPVVIKNEIYVVDIYLTVYRVINFW